MARRDKDKKEKEAPAGEPDDRSEAETQPVNVKDDAARANPKTDPPRTKTEPARARTEPGTAKELPDITPPEPKAEPWPDATPAPMRPVEAAAPMPPVEAEAAAPPAARTPTATMAMPPLSDLGKPPDMPSSSAPPPLAFGSVEDPTHMPGPKDVPAGDPNDPAPPPGRVPSGDSRSLRRRDEFALVYRVGTCVITRTGVVGTRGQWRVVEYPTSATASSSYAKECSRFVSEGFTDYRE